MTVYYIITSSLLNAHSIVSFYTLFSLSLYPTMHRNMVVLKMQECLSTSGYYITGTYTKVTVHIMEFVI